MFGIRSPYESDRNALINQYVTAWRSPEAFRRHDCLTEDMLSFADSLKGQPHSVIKAKTFAFLLEKAPVYINPEDWFGIALEVPKLDPLFDTGTPCHRPILDLSRQWTQEIAEQLHRAEDKHFVNCTKNYLFNEFYIDYNHSTPCWEDILSLGLPGLLERAGEYRKKHEPLSAEQQAYFDGIEISYAAFINLLKRYKNELDKYNEPKMLVMKKAIGHLIDNPPSNTYEALLLAWIYWFVGEQVEGIRVRSMGALDRLYYDFFKRDTESGLCSTDDIRELFTCFMTCFHAMRVQYQEPMYIGGVDEDGKCVVNELSYIILEAYDILSAPNPKLQAIISINTPDAFLNLVLRIIRGGNSSISIINHEIVESSLLRLGVTVEEARTYLMSGCWDYAIRNHEVKTVPIRVSLPKVLEYTMTNGICLTTGKQAALPLGESFDSFDEFLEAYEKEWLYIQQRAMSIIENWELYLAEISPSNLFSGTMLDSLERGVDGYARGMKYNNTVFTVCGLATLVDSLCAIKKFVFDEHRLNLKEFTDILRNNWEGHEELRREIVNDADKYGNGSAVADALCVRLVNYFASNTNLRPNSRGSFWKLGILSIDKNLRFGQLMCATPDGRLAGEPISKNLSPVIGMDRGGITALMNSLCKMDFTNFPHSAMLDVILHPTAVSGEDGLSVFASLVRTYFAKGGHSIQFNVFSADTLIAAQKEPEKFKNLQIRVCGWNVYFVDLEKPMQDAFIKEALHKEGRVSVQ